MVSGAEVCGGKQDEIANELERAERLWEQWDSSRCVSWQSASRKASRKASQLAANGLI